MTEENTPKEKPESSAGSFEPQFFITVFGKLTPEEFKKKFEAVFTQTEGMKTVTQGYVDFTMRYGTKDITVRTLRKFEMEFINILTPEAVNPTGAAATENKIRYDNLLLLMAVEKIGDLDLHSDFADVIKSCRTYESFMKNDKAKSKLAAFEGMSDDFILFLITLVNDVRLAAWAARREMVKNFN